MTQDRNYYANFQLFQTKDINCRTENVFSSVEKYLLHGR